uniref:MICOS complex subunit MIC10 n=1 Tax=Oncorhynchus tshawytscha TaxID=74940 RepID=A0AAZ3R2R5_ONCTS
MNNVWLTGAVYQLWGQRSCCPSPYLTSLEQTNFQAHQGIPYLCALPQYLIIGCAADLFFCFYSSVERFLHLLSPPFFSFSLSRCLSLATGLGVGIVFSVLFFKRRTWPVAFGSGVGLGMGYSNCQQDFRSPYQLHGHRVKEQ